MSEKNVDVKGRFRSVTVGFRMSPEEADLLNRLVKISGMNKQDYLIDRALQREITVIANPRVYIGLKRELTKLCEELNRINNSSDISNEQMTLIEQIVTILKVM